MKHLLANRGRRVRISLPFMWVVLAQVFSSCTSCTEPSSPAKDASAQVDGGFTWPTDGGGPMGFRQNINPGGFQLDAGSAGTGNGVGVTPDGHITLNAASIEFHFMWLANEDRGWVSKFDTRTGKETARYWSVVPKDCSGSAGPPCENGRVTELRGNDKNRPSRTAIDLFADMWVANRALGIQGSVTKIANDLLGCFDRNNDGEINTSRDRNGDGVISTDPADREMIIPNDWSNPNEYDECVLFSTPLGTPGTGIAGRSVAVSRGAVGTAGDIWYGDYRQHRVYKLNAQNGQPVPVNASGSTFIELGNFDGPYGAVIDGEQRLWMVAYLVPVLAVVDTVSGTLLNNDVQPPAGTQCGAYGIGLDAKNRIWLPGYNAGPIACRYEHGPGMTSTVGTWTTFNFSSARTPAGLGVGNPRGITVDEDGNVYMSMDNDGNLPPPGNVARLLRFDAETGALKPFSNSLGSIEIVDVTGAQTFESVGVGLDSDGNPWVNNKSGNAMRVDRTTGDVLLTAQQPAGLYSYSDFTGYQLRKFTAPRGSYTRDFEFCDNAQWTAVNFEGSTPPNTQISVYVRTAKSLADFAGSTRYGPFTSSPIDLEAAGVKRGRVLRVEFVLTSTDGQSKPVLKAYNVQWRCTVN